MVNIPRKLHGFTLVELSIVMVIIGLLIGGVLKGQEMRLNAQRTATLAQIDAFRVAYVTFVDMHQQLPGDTSVAEERLSGCTAANGCQNGDSNGVVGTNALPANQWYYEDQSAILSENTQFFRHLYAADLIGGLGYGNTIAWSESHPQAKIGNGGFQIARAGGPAANLVGQYYLRLQLPPSGDATTLGDAYVPISPINMSKMDLKVDDGNPTTGRVLAQDSLGPTACLNGTAYAVTEAFGCIGFFELFGR